MRLLRTSTWLGAIAVLCGCGASGHTDRDGPTSAHTAGAGGSAGSGGSGGNTALSSLPPPDKIDLLLMLDNSRSMDVKHQLFADAAQELVRRLRSPEAGVAAVSDIHVAVISSSLGDGGDNTVCDDPEDLDMSHVMGSTARGAVDSMNSQGFLEWHGGSDPLVFDGDLEKMIGSVGQVGCGFEASLEAWYRFLVDPAPYQSLVHVACDPVESGTNCATPATDESGNVLVDSVLLEQRAAFLRADSLLMIVALTDENDCSVRIGADSWKVSSRERQMPRAASACASDPNSRCCYSCGSTPPDGCTPDPVCDSEPTLRLAEDSINLRCEEQKRRFGTDFLYPVERYARALTEPKLCTLQPSLAVAGCPGETVDNPLFAGRPPEFVSYTSIVGVPWQDISAVGAGGDPERFRPVAELKAADWEQLLGQPHASPPVPPANPFMQESTVARAGIDSGNPINGREYDTVSYGAQEDLEFACIFRLPEPIDCNTKDPNLGLCDCFADQNDKPLCEETPGVSAPGPVQHFGKAYPGLRHLELSQSLSQRGGNVTLGSICAANTAREAEPSFGYRPAVQSVLDRVRPILSAR